jgi:DNA invertase Pin-like site-specific DNA recombinase
MLTDKLKELDATRTKLAALEQSVEADLKKELASLPARYGFANASGFIAAVSAATGKRRGRKARGGTASAKAGGKKRTRAKITDATRAEVKKLTEQGKSGSEIAKAVGISLPSVQNIKTALGLVKARK